MSLGFSVQTNLLHTTPTRASVHSLPSGMNSSLFLVPLCSSESVRNLVPILGQPMSLWAQNLSISQVFPRRIRNLLGPEPPWSEQSLLDHRRRRQLQNQPYRHGHSTAHPPPSFQFIPGRLGHVNLGRRECAAPLPCLAWRVLLRSCSRSLVSQPPYLAQLWDADVSN